MFELLTVSLLMTHELDAMTAKEWRIFPGLSRLSDEAGRWCFVVLHVPLFVAVFWGMNGADADTWRTVLNVFAIVHMLAHLALHQHAENGFRRPLSWVLIAGAATSGTLGLALGSGGA
jgi:hypothetical protein